MHKLNLAEVEAIIRKGLIGGTEPFPHWLRRATEASVNEAPGKLAAYLQKIGTESLRWEQTGPWKRDDRVRITNLIATLTPSHSYVGDELDWLSHAYQWKSNYKFDSTTKKWVAEIWLEYHCSSDEYEPIVLEVLEQVKVGEFSYPMFLHHVGASTDVGVQARVLAARGILNIRAEPDPEPEPDRWSSCLVVSLPSGDLAANPNLPPIAQAEVVGRTLRQTDFFIVRTDVWMRFAQPIPSK